MCWIKKASSSARFTVTRSPGIQSHAEVVLLQWSAPIRDYGANRYFYLRLSSLSLRYGVTSCVITRKPCHSHSLVQSPSLTIVRNFMFEKIKITVRPGPNFTCYYIGSNPVALASNPVNERPEIHSHFTPLTGDLWTTK